MGWSSTTRVARVRQAARDAVWERIRALPADPGRSLVTPVCCYALQGVCHFGPSACEYSHDLRRAGLRGCQFGSKCRVGHDVGLGVGPDGSSAADHDGTSLDGGIMDSIRARDGAAYVECRGPYFDDTDPLWDEVACALRNDDEDVGDGDLSFATRERLAAAGQYRLVNEDTADEWICIPAQVLQRHLESAQHRVAQSRRLWLVDDLGEARGLWQDVLGALRSRLPRDGGLQRALASADAALHRAFLLRPQDRSGCGRNLLEALLAARGAVGVLRRLASDAVGWRRASMVFDVGESLDGQFDEDLRGKFTEIWRCLERCIFLSRTISSDAKHEREQIDGDAAALGGAGSQRGGSLAALEVGSAVQITGLTSPAEERLNGEEGQLERYDEAFGLWQVRLHSSGTRLLLGEEHMAASRHAARKRSRSPRRPGDARNILELTKEAAKHGEHVLVHHVVGWSGSDLPMGK